MSNLGTASLKLQTQANGLDAGLGQAEKSIKGFLININNNMSVMATGWTGMFLGALKGVMDSLGGVMERVGSAVDASAALGISTRELMGWQHAASLCGISSEALSGSLRKMLNTLGDAKLGSVEARDALARLGISMETVNSSNPTQMFETIADRLNAITDPMERARAATSIFGREGASLLPLFERGAEGIREAVAEAERLGIALNDTDAAAIDSAGDALDTLKASLGGILAQVAVAIAPVIEQVSQAVTQVVSTLLPIIQQILQAFQPIGAALMTLFETVMAAVMPLIMGIAQTFSLVAEIVTPIIEIIVAAIQVFIDIFSPLFDAIGSIMPPFETVGSVVRSVIAGIVTGFRVVMQVVASVVRFLARIPIIGRIFRGASAGLDSFVENVRSTENRLRNPTPAAARPGSPGARPGGGASTAAADLTNDIIKQEADLRKSIATFGMSRDEIALWELQQRGATAAQLETTRALQAQLRVLEANRVFTRATAEINEQIGALTMSRDEVQLMRLAEQGLTLAQLDQVRALQQQRNAIESRNRLMEEGRSLTESLRTPQEKFADEMDRLQGLLDNGAISWDTYERAASRALQDVAKEAQAVEMKTPTAMRAGSSAAAETIIRAQMAGSVDNSREGIMQRIATEQREFQRQGVEIARDTLRVLRDRGGETI